MPEDLKKHIQRWKWGTKPSRFQVGPMLFFREIQLDNYFLMKLYRKYITENNYETFYKYHLDHYRACTDNPNEETHFKLIFEIIKSGISIQNRYPYSEFAKKRRNKLLAFQQYLIGIDQWNQTSSLEELLHLKNKEIDELSLKLEIAKNELSKLKVDYKIKINQVNRTSIFDLFLQIRELAYPKDGGRVFNDPAQSTWAKILANHFEDENSIPFSTALNYFRGKTIVDEKYKLFEIKPTVKA